MPPLIRYLERRRTGFRLWHLSVAVLVLAIAFGLIRAGVDERHWGTVVTVTLFWVGVATLIGLYAVGVKAGNRAALFVDSLGTGHGWVTRAGLRVLAVFAFFASFLGIIGLAVGIFASVVFQLARWLGD